MDDLVALLQKANYAYHNTDTPILSDEEYDKKLEELRSICPSHPFLNVIGASVGKSAVLLPVILGSQDKVRAGEGGLERWMKRDASKLFVVSEKLDGLSALYVKSGSRGRFYLRGDGVKGVDVSRILSSIHGVPDGNEPCMVRGELLLSKDATPEGSIGRSLVNGWVHRALDSDLPEGLRNVRFVAYQVLEPSGMTRSQQLKWLSERGFEVPWSATWPRLAVTDDRLKKTLLERKEKSLYPLDGLVVGTDRIPVSLGGGETRNPPDSVAYKASLDEQKAETTVLGIEWNVSRQGMYIPRIQIEPVSIGGATIQWISGHNSGLIEKNHLGPGARIVVRRSGDVIPTVDSVLEGVEVSIPGDWDENHVHTMALDASPEKSLLHALETLGVEGVGPGLVKKMVEGGVDTMKKLWESDVEKDLAPLIGAGRASSLRSSLDTCRTKASILTLLLASNRLPRGIGEKKLRSLGPDPKAWKNVMEAPGWSSKSLAELKDSLEDAFQWVNTSFPGYKESSRTVAPVTTTAPVAIAAPTNFVVFTGIRDHELETRLPSYGWQVNDSVSKKTTVVVSGSEKESGKVRKARELGIEILSMAEFRKRIGQ